MSREEVMAEIRRLQSEFPNLLSAQPATTLTIDLTPNKEVIDAETEPTDHGSEDVEVLEGGYQEGGSMDKVGGTSGVGSS